MSQAFPPSITGKGHGGSVLDHAFGAGDPYTLGIVRVFNANRDIVEVVRAIADQTEIAAASVQ